LTFDSIRSRVISRLEWGATDATAKSLAGAAINEGQRIFCFLTLCLEATRPLILTPGKAFYRMYTEKWDDWLVPLRLNLSSDTSGGADTQFGNPELGAAMPNQQLTPGLVAPTSPKLRAASLYEMAAASDTFVTDSGTPSMYGCIGWDLLFFNSRPTIVGQKVNTTYARSSVAMVNDGDIPEMHDADHEALIGYGVWRLRANEGGQELQSANSLMKEYLDCAKQRANQVRARALAQRYDRQPFELESIDYSKLLKTRMDLPPYRKENRWTGQA
jgi:hypothetical protein